MEKNDDRLSSEARKLIRDWDKKQPLRRNQETE